MCADRPRRYSIPWVASHLLAAMDGVDREGGLAEMAGLLADRQSGFGSGGCVVPAGGGAESAWRLVPAFQGAHSHRRSDASSPSRGTIQARREPVDRPQATGAHATPAIQAFSRFGLRVLRLGSGLPRRIEHGVGLSYASGAPLLAGDCGTWPREHRPCYAPPISSAKSGHTGTRRPAPERIDRRESHHPIEALRTCVPVGTQPIMPGQAPADG